LYIILYICAMGNESNILKYPIKALMTKQDFTVVERRILYLAMQQIKQGMGVQKNLFNKGFELSIPYNSLEETNWNRFKEAIKKLDERRLVFVDNDEEYESLHLVYKIQIKKNETVKVFFSPEGSFLLAELGKGYASLQFNLAMSLTSEYAQRMYELLSRWKDTGIWVNQEIDTIRELLNVPGSYNLGMFKKQVLDYAQKELREHTDISFTYELMKTGRSFTRIDFYITNQTERSLFNNDPEVKQDDKSVRCLEHLKKMGVNRKDLQDIIIKEKQDLFWKWLVKWKQMPDSHKAKVKNPTGLMLVELGLSGQSK